ncbi:MAG TPA: hypothetical protein VE733_22225 [Streptosporangiaceae bacterium]|jgi:hypothetical protein|nr:hypothetical protein [Streptosporangiaceae bacterium]
MVHQTTANLPDDRFAVWKASGLPLSDVIGRGLDRSGDTARHAAMEARLADPPTIIHPTAEERTDEIPAP